MYFSKRKYAPTRKKLEAKVKRNNAIDIVKCLKNINALSNNHGVIITI